MSPDPVISAIDSAIADHDELLASMARNAERFHPFGPAPEWATATTRGWVPKVSPAATRYFPELETLPASAFTVRLYTEPPADPFGGPVPSPTVEGSVPAEDTVGESAIGLVRSHRAAHPLRVWWVALRRRVGR